MPDQPVDLNDVLLTPLALIIEKVGAGVAFAQTQLDSASMAAQQKLQEQFPALAEVGYQVTWYQMPEVQVELKVAVHYEETGKADNKKASVLLTPFNAKYKNAFTYTADGASTLRFKIVPVPPPVVQTT